MTYTSIETSASEGRPYYLYQFVEGEQVWRFTSRAEDWTSAGPGGSAVSRDAADSFKRVTLELGGKSPNLIFADADLDKRVAEGVDACFFNTGQSCDAPSRMLVEHSVYSRVLELAQAAAESTIVGNPEQEGDHLGPLFDEIQYDRVQTMIRKGIDEGARLLSGGLDRPAGLPEALQAGWFVRPTIFCDVTPEMVIWREEIFGPVLVITPFETEEEGIRLANDTTYGLAAFIQTGSEDRALRVARRLRAGGIHINGRDADYGSPFGGFKHSGNGREGGVYGLEDYMEIKVRPPFAA